MNYRLIEGHYWLFRESHGEVNGYEPDGDSIRFRPKNPRRFYSLPGRRTRFNQGGSVQLRFDGIDALEIHYDGLRQHPELALAARDRLLDAIGFQQVEYDDQGTHVISAYPHPLPGFVMTQHVDRNRRPICFAFAGKSPEPDGGQMPLEPTLLRKSLNALLITEGLAYPAYYSNLTRSIRHELTHLANKSRHDRRGIWAADPSFDQGAEVRSTRDLITFALWPKLFRRLADFFRAGNTDVNEFLKWLQQNGRENNHLQVIPTGERCRLNDVIEIRDNRVRMTRLPQELIVAANIH